MSLGESKLIHINASQENRAVDTESHLYGEYHLFSACWDEFSGCLYATAGRDMPTRVVRVTEGGSATVVAGQQAGSSADGESDTCNLHRRGRRSVPLIDCDSIASDGEGCLYCVAGRCLRRLRLPATWQAPLPTAVVASACGGAAPTMFSQHAALLQQQQDQQQQGQARGGLGEGAASRGLPTGGEVEVTAVKCGEVDGRILDLAYDSISRSLVLCTRTAVYRLPIAGLGEAAAVHEPVLLAGQEDDSEGHMDGMGTDARFDNIHSSIAVDGRSGVGGGLADGGDPPGPC